MNLLILSLEARRSHSSSSLLDFLDLFLDFLDTLELLQDMLDLLHFLSELLDLLNLFILPMQGFAGAAAVFLQCKNPSVYQQPFYHKCILRYTSLPKYVLHFLTRSVCKCVLAAFLHQMHPSLHQFAKICFAFLNQECLLVRTSSLFTTNASFPILPKCISHF